MAVRERYVDTASTPGGNGTTTATSGANRAYASLNEALGAEATASPNLVTATEILKIHCKGSTADTGEVDIQDFTTSSSYYIHIVVDQADRHDGKWNTGKYRLVNGGYYGALTCRNDHIIIEGLQIEQNATSVSEGARNGINYRSSNSGGFFTVRECVVRYTGDFTNQQPYGITDNGRGGTGVTVKIVNNVVYDFKFNIMVSSQTSDVYAIYHNTHVDATDTSAVIYRYGSGSTINFENNLGQGANTNYYFEGSSATFNSAGNISEDTSSPESGGRSLVITFTNEAADDFHTSDTDAVSSTNLYADGTHAVTIDIDGQSRPSSGNVYAGADQPGASGYSLTAAQGSFTLSGQAAALKAGRKVTASQGSFTLSGQAASLKAGRKLTAAQGSFSLSGQAATLKAARRITAAQGTFTLTGQAAALKVGRKLTASVGNFTLSGQAASLIYTPANSYTLTASQGTFALTGQAANLLCGRKLVAAQGSFTLSGQSASLLPSRILTAAQGSFVLSGQAVVFRRALVLNAGAGIFVLSGQTANLLYGVLASNPIKSRPGNRRTFSESAGSRTYGGRASARRFSQRGEDRH